ncbi:MAG: hypothetical protein LBK99_23165 [Opitutaceae bacterium]|jgi:hypothetical protein|nr:hypothetical protein [Opitutaceae bacterium]
MMQHAGRFVAEQGAELIYLGVRDRRGTVTPEEIAEAKARMEERRRELFDAMAKDVQAARRLGVSQGVVVQSLDAKRLSARDIALLLTGRYLPYVDASPFSRQRAAAGTGAQPAVRLRAEWDQSNFRNSLGV